MVESRFTNVEEYLDMPFRPCKVKAKDINLAISETHDGRTCLYCDYPLEEVPSLVVLNQRSASIYLFGGDFGTEGMRLQYPLEYDKIEIWKREGVTYFALIGADVTTDVFEIDVHFVDVEDIDFKDDGTEDAEKENK
ncbi:MAG: hypothetical protein EA357_03495 [Micavibrio sp.]|nr:MAG: hypothetical protein EA357_03495 [Micavibrio sp.]